MKWKRILSGILGSILFFFSRLRKWLVFKYLTLRHGISNAYIWEAFVYLAGLDMTDEHGYADVWYQTADGIDFKGCGFYLEIRDQPKEKWFVCQQLGSKGQLVVQGFKKEKRRVSLECGVPTESNWWDVYRSNAFVAIEDTKELITYLKKLYGNGPEEAKCKHTPKKNYPSDEMSSTKLT